MSELGTKKVTVIAAIAEPCGDKTHFSGQVMGSMRVPASEHQQAWELAQDFAPIFDVDNDFQNSPVREAFDPTRLAKLLGVAGDAVVLMHRSAEDIAAGKYYSASIVRVPQAGEPAPELDEALAFSF